MKNYGTLKRRLNSIRTKLNNDMDDARNQSATNIQSRHYAHELQWMAKNVE